MLNIKNMKKTILLFISFASFISFVYAQNITDNGSKTYIPILKGSKSLSTHFYSENNLSEKNKDMIKASTLICKYDSIYGYSQDSATHQWVVYARNKYTYDANNNQTNELGQQWFVNKWWNYFQYTYVYDLDNNMINETDLYYTDTTNICDNDYSLNRICTYDTNNNMTDSINQRWNYTSNSWANSTKYTFTYDTNINMIKKLYQLSSGGVGWINDRQWTYTYNSHNDIKSELQSYFDGSTWNSSNQILYTYDIYYNMIKALEKVINGSWVNSYQTIWTYDTNNNIISQLYQYWNGNSWENNIICSCTYDLNNNRTSVFQQNWNGSAWENAFITYYTYNTNNNLIGEYRQSWVSGAWENWCEFIWTICGDNNNCMRTQNFNYWDNNSWVKNDSLITFCIPYTGIADEPQAKISEFEIFPNPANTSLTIESQQKSVIEIFNIEGQIIKAFNNADKETIIDISNLSSGVYIIKAKTDRGVAIKKFIKQ